MGEKLGDVLGGLGHSVAQAAAHQEAGDLPGYPPAVPEGVPPGSRPGRIQEGMEERDYATIIAVARKILQKIHQEDPKLLMWYDQALTRTGEG